MHKSRFHKIMASAIALSQGKGCVFGYLTGATVSVCASQGPLGCRVCGTIPLLGVQGGLHVQVWCLGLMENQTEKKIKWKLGFYGLMVRGAGRLGKD